MTWVKGKIIRRASSALILMAVLGLIFITTVDKTPYQETSFYASTIARKDSLVKVLEQQEQQSEHTEQEQQLLFDTLENGLQGGWGMANITPQEPVRLTGKNYTPYEQVFDSVFVRTFLFEKGELSAVLISYDLWIMHTVLATAVRKMIRHEFPEIKGIFFTANHSHTSIGGWGAGLLGSLITGGNNPETVSFIVEHTRVSINRAKQRLGPVKAGYGALETQDLVTNRLDENGLVDQKLRVFKLESAYGGAAAFTTFSAHSVYMNKDINTLSADYPGPYLQFAKGMGDMEFVSFAPGATGSHTPIGRKPFEYQRMLNYSRQLANYFDQVQAKIVPEESTDLKYLEWPVDLRSPHFRISNHLRVRPWLYHLVMSKQKANISVLRVGKVVMVGLPVELSGEYYPGLEDHARNLGLSLMITSFNGWYLGYVNPEKYYYTLNRSETRGMNWYGPQNGEYFVELIKRVLEII